MTDPFTQLQKGKFPLEKITKHAETLDLDEAANSISQARTSPNYSTLKIMVCSLETVLFTQKQLLREISELKTKIDSLAPNKSEFGHSCSLNSDTRWKK